MRRPLDRTTLPVLSTDAMRAADRATIEDFGIPSFTLMECAARGAFGFIAERWAPIAERNALIFAGSGGNGGDGLALARMLAGAGARVLVLTTATPDGPGDTALNLRLLERLEDDPACAVQVLRVTADTDLDELGNLTLEFVPCDFCVDALLGIGLGGELREPLRTLAHWTVAHDDVIALDVPTGVDSDTGEVRDEAAVVADVTLTMGAVKPGLLFGDGREHSGEVHVIEFGLPPFVLAEGVRAEGSALLATDAFVAAQLPHRPFDAHKFSVGHVLAVAGCDRFPGAAVLASRAAQRVGAGYVTCATTERAAGIVDVTLAEVATQVVDRSERAAADLARAHGRSRCVLIGPGLGDGAGAFVRALLAADWACSLVLDADGLNALEGDEGRAALRTAAERLARAGHAVILTPHPGEYARLVGAEVGPSPLAAARALARDLGAIVVLKGAPTVIAPPGAGPPFVAREVEPALATAGSGDVLAGMIAGLVAQGAEPLAAAVTAVHLGGAAAAEAVASRAERSIVAMDVVEALPRVLARIEAGERPAPGLAE